MKRYISAIVATVSICLPSLAQSRDSLPGFLDVKWGDSVAVAKSKLSKRFKFNEALSDRLIFVGTFAGIEGCTVIAFTHQGVIKEAAASYADMDNNKTLDGFEKLSTAMKAKYGKPDRYEFKSKYSTEPVDLERLVASNGLALLTWPAERTPYASVLNDVKGGSGAILMEWVFADKNLVQLRTETHREHRTNVVYNVIHYISSEANNQYQGDNLKDL